MQNHKNFCRIRRSPTDPVLVLILLIKVQGLYLLKGIRFIMETDSETGVCMQWFGGGVTPWVW